MKRDGYVAKYDNQLKEREEEEDVYLFYVLYPCKKRKKICAKGIRLQMAADVEHKYK